MDTSQLCFNLFNFCAGYEEDLQIAANTADQGIRCDVIPERHNDPHRMCGLMVCLPLSNVENLRGL